MPGIHLDVPLTDPILQRNPWHRFYMDHVARTF